jgi:hypothetical protein
MDFAAISERLRALEERTLEQQLDELESQAAIVEEPQALSETDQMAQLRVQNHLLESRLAKITEQLDNSRQGRGGRRNSNGHHRSSKPNQLKRILGIEPRRTGQP